MSLNHFDAAKEKLIQHIPCPIIAARIKRISVASTDTAHINKNLRHDQYRRFVRVPAYYDPNNHTVYLNTPVIRRGPHLTRYIICYHELLHGASVHRNYKTSLGTHVFQSGIKIERFSQKSYRCINRQLNEGCIQYVATHNNNVPSNRYGYAEEVALVEKLALVIGRDVIHSALFYGKLDHLITEFEAVFGRKTFALFSRHLDRRNYQAAREILRYPQTLAKAHI